jgi:hypothetical protein
MSILNQCDLCDAQANEMRFFDIPKSVGGGHFTSVNGSATITKPLTRGYFHVCEKCIESFFHIQNLRKIFKTV